MRFVCADALSGDDEVANGIHAAADVMLCLCTAFSQPMMHALAARLASCKPGAFLLTATVPLPSAVWTVLEVLYLPMSWGATKIYIQKKADDFPRWEQLHAGQLAAIALPRHYWRPLHRAVREQRFDAAAWVQVCATLCYLEHPTPRIYFGVSAVPIGGAHYCRVTAAGHGRGWRPLCGSRNRHCCCCCRLGHRRRH